jgi:uncharacterized protein (DUF1800 family)
MAEVPLVSVALNRFGLGARPGDHVPDDPTTWLTDQFARFDPRPQPIAAAASSAAVAAELAEYFAQQRQIRQSYGGRPAMAPGAPAVPMAATDPELTATGAGMAAVAGAVRSAAAVPLPGNGVPPAPADKPGEPMTPEKIAQQEQRRFARREGQDDYGNLVAARADAALVTDTPFVERMVHFWANHFAVSADKLGVIGLAGTLEMEAIRPHVLGSFRDLLSAVEHHPAMLLYLDQAVSVGPDSSLGQRIAARGGPRKIGLNENLAREIMELHTLGVRTGYTQADVTEFARAMTGWTVAGIGQGPGARAAMLDGPPGSFFFAAMLHEPGERMVIGRRYGEVGEAQAQACLDAFAVHPATAAHLATKLSRHFAGDTPPPAMVRRVQAAFLRSGGDLPSVYRAIVASPEAWVPEPVKFRTPWEWSIATMRALGTKQVAANQIVGLLGQLGQPTWKPGQPVGYDDLAASWAGPDAIMRRVEAAERFAGRAGDVDARALAPKLFPAALSPATAQALDRAESPGQALALLLVSPEMMRR